MPSPFPGLNVDHNLAPIDSEPHAVLRALVLYVTNNDGFPPEIDELASATGLSEWNVRKRLDDLEAAGLARFGGAHWWPARRDLNVPPVAEASRLKRAG